MACSVPTSPEASSGVASEHSVPAPTPCILETCGSPAAPSGAEPRANAPVAEVVPGAGAEHSAPTAGVFARSCTSPGAFCGA
eukprot:8534122-Alexandrium_andersonii.AAC.1